MPVWHSWPLTVYNQLNQSGHVTNLLETFSKVENHIIRWRAFHPVPFCEVESVSAWRYWTVTELISNCRDVGSAGTLSATMQSPPRDPLVWQHLHTVVQLLLQLAGHWVALPPWVPPAQQWWSGNYLWFTKGGYEFSEGWLSHKDQWPLFHTLVELISCQGWPYSCPN